MTGSPEPDVGLHSSDLVIEVLAATEAELREEVRGWREVSHARNDFCAWLQRELCAARRWTSLDVLHAWTEELERRARQRRDVAA